MNTDSSIRKQNEEMIKIRTDEIWENGDAYCICDILNFAADNDIEQLSVSYLAILTQYFLDYYKNSWTESEIKDIEKFFTFLYYMVKDFDLRQISFQNNRLFYEYCFIIRQSVFCCLGQSYTKGITYYDLIDKILNDLGIDNISREIKKRLYNSFRQYIQKCLDGNGNFESIALPTWASHIGIKEKNRGQESIDSILARDRAAYEFDFYIRPKYKTDDKELRTVIEKLEEETKKRIIPILEELGFNEIIQNWDVSRKKYSKLAQMPLRAMEEEELILYMKFMDCKRVYVRYNAAGSPPDGALAERWLSHILGYSLLEFSYSTRLKERDFSVAGGILAKINNRLVHIQPSIIEKCTGILLESTLSETIFWNGMLQLVNIMDTIVNTLNEKGLGFPRSYCQALNNKENFDLFKYIYERETVIQPKHSKEIIKKQFVDKLWQDNTGWQDLIEICYLTTHNTLWAEEREESRYSDGMLDEKELSCFGMAFSYIIQFLRCCSEKAQLSQLENKEKVNISSEIESLKDKLASLDIILETEDFDFVYYNEHIKKKGKSKKVGYSDYFKKCLETAPTRLYILLENDFESGKSLDVKQFLQKYMKTILNRRKGEELLVPPQYDIQLPDVLYPGLLLSERHSYRVQDHIYDFYDKEIRLLNICQKYDIVKTFWHPNDEQTPDQKTYAD